MDPTLSHALVALVTSLLSGVAALGAATVTAESSLFAPLRARLREQSLHRVAELRDISPSVIDYAADLVSCTLCSSWWHGLWLTPTVTALLGGGVSTALIAYFVGGGVVATLLAYRPVKPAMPAKKPTLLSLLDDAA